MSDRLDLLEVWTVSVNDIDIRLLITPEGWDTLWSSGQAYIDDTNNRRMIDVIPYGYCC